MARTYEYACPECFAVFKVEGANDRQTSLSAANWHWHHHKESGDCQRELETLGREVHPSLGLVL